MRPPGNQPADVARQRSLDTVDRHHVCEVVRFVTQFLAKSGIGAQGTCSEPIEVTVAAELRM